jgi:ectoine hydroxylase
MQIEDILKSSTQVISEAERQFYFDKGYLCLPSFVNAAEVDELRAVTAELVESSRGIGSSNDRFDLGANHCAQMPEVRRIRAAVDQHPRYWQCAADSAITDLAADLVGPDVKFHSAKLNFKAARGGDEVKWHQDIQAWPHTNYSPVTIGIYLEDVSADQGPLQAIPGSHNGPLFDQFNDDVWTGHIAERDVSQIDLRTAADMPGPAGTVVVVNCRTVHGSRPNLGAKDRPLLLFVYSAADAFTYTAAPTPTSHTGEIVRGQLARWAHHDPRPCRIPPDWAKTGYGSIFSAQTGEESAAR